MTVRSAALIGAGAVGAYFIWGMAGVPDIDFCLVAEGERAERLQRDGVLINGETYHLPVKPPEEAKDCDLIIVAVKYSGLESAISEIRRMAGEDTIVLSVMNGIDSEDLIAAEIGEARVMHAFMRIASRRADGRIAFDPEVTAGVFFGEKDRNNETDRVAALCEFFGKTNVKFHVCEDIILKQWEKYQTNICYNLPQAVLGTGYGSYFDSEHVEYIRAALDRELVAVAHAEGIALQPLQLKYQGYQKSARYSTLQDLDAKRHTEIDMFLGVLSEEAQSHGIEVPASRLIFHEIKALEEKNDGKFDYDGE